MPLRESLTAGVTAGETAEHAKAWALINRRGHDVEDPDYGASPSNSAAANTTAIQAAINAAEAAWSATGGKRVVYLPRLYPVNTLTISKPIIMVGAGWDAGLIAGSGLADYVIKFATAGSNVTGAYLGNFQIDGNLSATAAGSGGIYAKGAVQCHFDHLWLHHAVDACLWLHEIASGDPGHHTRVTNCLFDNNSGSSGHGQGIRLQANDEVWVTNCDFESLGGAGSEPYAIKDWSGINHLIGNNFVGGKDAIRVQDTSGTRIIGNMFDGVGGSCVHVAGSGCVISGNVFSGGGQSTAGTYSHIVQDGTGANVISGNYFSTDATAGRLRSFIRELGTSVANSAVTGNRFTINGALGTAAVERNSQWNLYAVNSGYTDPTINSQSGTTYTLVLADRDRPVELANAGTTTVTVPANVFSAGDIVPEITRMSGPVTLSAGAGMTLRTPTGTLSLRAQYSSGSIRFRSATEGVVAGDLT